MCLSKGITYEWEESWTERYIKSNTISNWSKGIQ